MTAGSRLEEIRLLYLRELRAALRERNIVVNSILIPLFLYPVMLWMMMSGWSFVRGQEERFVSRVALVGLPAAPTAAGLDDNFRLRLVFDASKDRSAKARERLEAAIGEYRDAWLERSAEALGMGPAEWQRFRIERHNVASGGEMGAFVIGMMVPFLMIVMIALGCLYPAVDATAGERERSTWETLMTVAASRTSVVVAKYLYVATLGGLAGLLNLFALTLTMRAILGPILGGEARELVFEIPYAALPLLALSAVLLAMLIAALMMIVAAFSRTFKEGQSMVQPVLLFSMLPPLLTQSPDLTLTPKMALVPIANVALMFREAIAGIYRWPMIGLVLAVQVAAVALCLVLARRILAFEDVLIGSYGGSFGKFVKERLLQRGGATGGAP